VEISSRAAFFIRFPTVLASKGAKPEPPRKHDKPSVSGLMVQGALLLQSLLKLPDTYNRVVIASIASLEIEERLLIAHDASGSRIYDVLLESPTVPLKAKRHFVTGFIGHYHLLVDDRIGSRVGDRCWNFADTYLKEKIARSLIIHEQLLTSSYYGKYFARNLNLYLLQRRPDEWKTMQAERKRSKDQADVPLSAAPRPPVVAEASPQKHTKRKRHAPPDDEIDTIFSSTLGKRIKKAALDDISTAPLDKLSKKDPKAPEGLQGVFGAIRLAPKDRARKK